MKHCNKCNVDLVTRADDTEEVAKKRKDIQVFGK